VKNSYGERRLRLDRRTKEKVVAELHEKLKDTKLAVLAGNSGMNVEKMTALRNTLRKSGAELRVVKNTLLGIASKNTDFSGLEEYFKGPLAILLNRGDVVGPTKALVEFAKKNAELEIRVGMLNGKLLRKDQLIALAELPGREVLLGKLLSVMVGVQTSLVYVLSGVPRSFICVLDAYRAKKESGN
jgi:large subunit ribosomal protein L10